MAPPARAEGRPGCFPAAGAVGPGPWDRSQGWPRSRPTWAEAGVKEAFLPEAKSLLEWTENTLSTRFILDSQEDSAGSPCVSPGLSLTIHHRPPPPAPAPHPRDLVSSLREGSRVSPRGDSGPTQPCASGRHRAARRRCAERRGQGGGSDVGFRESQCPSLLGCGGHAPGAGGGRLPLPSGDWGPLLSAREL